MGGTRRTDDLLLADYGRPADGKPSAYYHYPDAVFSNDISATTREFLRARHTDVDKVRDMVDGGLDIHTANANGFTGLHMAAARFKLDIAELLVEMGADVNVEECNGMTPLDYCVDSGAKGEQGKWSEKNGDKNYQAMVEFLESKGGMRRQERCWMNAANQAKYAPNQE